MFSRAFCVCLTWLLIPACFLFRIALCSSDQDPCCENFIVDHKKDEFVYPLTWLPYVQDKIYFSVDAGHDAIISLSKHMGPNVPRYTIVFQKDKASINRCDPNTSYFSKHECISEIKARNSQPFLINGTSKFYWIKQDLIDFTLSLGEMGETKPFLEYTPSHGMEVSITWIGLLSSSSETIKWQFCNLAVKDISKQKPSFQSSILFEGPNSYDASLANGYSSSIQLPGPIPGSCSQTAASDIEPWWKVDLLKEYNVKLVRLWNDINDTDISLKLGGAAVYVGTTPSFTTHNIKLNNKFCGAGTVSKHEAETDKIIVRSCDIVGRYVYVVKSTPWLKICGLEVFGTEIQQTESSKETCKEFTDDISSNAGSSSVAISCIVFVLVFTLIIISGWVYFAYTHPSSSSGLCLLKISGRFHQDSNSTNQVAKYTLVSPGKVQV